MSLDLRLVAYQPNGPRLGVLPTPDSCDVSAVLGDVGAFSMGYPSGGPRIGLLADACEVAAEVSYDGGLTWTEPDDLRYLRLRRSGDQVGQAQTITYEGPGYVWRLSKASVLPEGALNADGKRAFLSATVGTIMRTLALEAQGRGALAGMDFSTFTSSQDSTGTPWSQIVTLYYEPGVDYLTVLMNLQAQGLCNFTMRGRSLRLYDADTVMAGDSGAALLRGRDLVDAPYRGTLENLSNYAYLAGDNGVSLERTNPEASAPWGRWETYISQGGVSDTGTMTVLSDASLSLTGAERVERTYELSFARDGVPLPFRDYKVGQQVLVRAGTDLPESLRLRSITLSRDGQGVVGGNVVLNDRFLENDVRQTRRITGITGGSTMDGGSGARPNPGGDRTTPSAPLGVIADTDAYVDDAGRVFAAATVSWDAVTTNTDGTAVTDLAQYEVLYRLSTDAAWALGASVDGGATTASFSGLEPARDYVIGVRAVDSSLHRSAITTVTVTTADDDVAPTQPSTPLVAVYLGQLLITWDGLNNVGGQPPLDFDRVEVHVGTAPGFTPTAATLVDTITSRAGGSTVATDLTYDTTYYARLVAYDVRGNVSTPSAAASGVPLRAADGDITSMTANKITAGAISAAITVSGRIATSLTGARVEMNSNGLKAYDSTGALTVDVPSDGSGPTFVGTFRTAFSGARAELKAVTGSAALLLYSGMASETAPGGLSTTVLGTGSAADAVLTIAAPQKNSLDRATLEMRSRDSDTGADFTFHNYNGSVFWNSDSGYGTHYWRNESDGVAWAVLARNGASGFVLGGGSGANAPRIAVGVNDLNIYPNLSGGVGTVKVIGNFDTSSGTLNMTDEFGAVRLSGATDGTGSYIKSTVLYNRTSTFTANVGIATSPQGVLYRITSSRRYKVLIEDQDVPLDGLRALRPRSYVDRTQWQDAGEDATGLKRHLGLIAEEVAEVPVLGDLLVPRDEDGQPGSVDYDRLAVALLPWLHHLEREVRVLQHRMGSLKP